MMGTNTVMARPQVNLSSDSVTGNFEESLDEPQMILGKIRVLSWGSESLLWFIILLI